jgi:hypothetical protein
MSLKSKLQFLYEIFLGTTVDYVETHENIGPSEFKKINDSFYILKQKNHDCGILLNDSEILLINTSFGTACEDLVKYIQTKFPNHRVTSIVYSAASEEATGGAVYYPGHKRYLPDDIKNRTEIIWGNEILIVTPVNHQLEIELKNNKAIYKNLRFYFL